MIIKNKDIKSIQKKSTYIKKLDINTLKNGNFKVSKVKLLKQNKKG